MANVQVLTQNKCAEQGSAFVGFRLHHGLPRHNTSFAWSNLHISKHVSPKKLKESQVLSHDPVVAHGADLKSFGPVKG